MNGGGRCDTGRRVGRRRRVRRLTRAPFLVLWLFSFPAVVAAQDERPDSAPGQEPSGALTLPPVHETVLPSGLRVLVVPESPEGTGPDSASGPTTWTLLLPGGSSADPVGREGLSAILAAAMERAGMEGIEAEGGAAEATEAEGTGPDGRVAGASGRAFGVSTSADALALTVVDSTSTPHGTLDLLLRALLAPAPSGPGLERLRSERLEVIERSTASPDGVAVALVTAALYGSHPYGRRETPESLAAIGPEALQAWRRRHVEPDGAVLAVAGPVDEASVVAAVGQGLRAWLEATEEEAGRADGVAEARDREGSTHPADGPSAGGPERLLAHWPDLPDAVVHVAFSLPAAAHEDWTRLAVLDGVLGDGPDARLFALESPDGGEIVAAAATAAQRRRGPGLFHARAAVRVGVVPEVVPVLMEGLASAGRDLATPQELRPVQERLVTGLAQQVAMPQRVAPLLAVNRILGLPDSALVTYPERVQRVGPQDLRDVARRHLDTARAAVVVVGDAGLLLPDLVERGFTLVDQEGRPMDPASVERPRAVTELDATVLEPVTLEYRVLVAGEEVGRLTRTLQPGPDSLPGTLTYRASGALGGRDVSQSVTFRVDGFEPVAADARVTVQGRTAGLDVVVREGRIRGSITGSGAREVDVPLPSGAVIGDMVELVAWLLPEREGETWRTPFVLPERGSVDPAVYRVGPVEEVTVPAGTFRARRVDVRGQEGQTLWLRTGEGLRVPVRIRSAGQPVTLELVRVEGQ